jgi:hypothetical protein
MFYIGLALGITCYFLYLKLAETKRELKVTKADT